MQIHRAEGIARDAAVVVQQRRGLRVLRREGVQVADKGAVCGINHRRAQPFEQHCVAFAQKTQRLADVPGADVKPFIFNKFKSVLAFVNRQIMRGRADVKRAHVVVAVGRGEAPGAAAAFHGEKEMQVFLLRQGGEFGGDGLHHDRAGWWIAGGNHTGSRCPCRIVIFPAHSIHGALRGCIGACPPPTGAAFDCAHRPHLVAKQKENP